MTRAIGMATFLFVVGGCAPTLIQVDGYQLEKERTEKAFEEIRTRASFEFECPKDQLKLTVLKVNEVLDIGSSYDRAQHVGVSGCEKKAVYVRNIYTEEWIMNTATE